MSTQHDDFIRKNTLVYDYTLSHINNITEICRPLSNLGIDDFSWLKITKNEELIFLTNVHKDFIKEFYLETYKDDPLLHLLSTNKNPVVYYIWPENATDAIAKLLNKYSMYSGMAICYRDGETIQMFCFSFRKYFPNYTNFFINHIQQLTNFISYFRTIYNPVLNNCNIMANYNGIIPNQSFIINSPITIETCNVNIIQNDNTIIFSAREIQCIRAIKQNKTSKEIAQELGISYRTVESYIEHIKDKAGLDSKHDIKFYKNINHILEF
jgi:DNA-binding CsgD family transcriptional regulator